MQLLSHVPPIHHDFFQRLVGKELDIDSSEAEESQSESEQD